MPVTQLSRRGSQLEAGSVRGQEESAARDRILGQQLDSEQVTTAWSGPSLALLAFLEPADVGVVLSYRSGSPNPGAREQSGG